MRRSLCSLVGIGSAGLFWLNAQNSNDDLQIARLNNAGWIRERIAANKNNPTFSRHTLAALYCRLLDLDGDGGQDCLRDSLAAYKLLVGPDLQETSYYTYWIATFCAYNRFKELDCYQAAVCAQKALTIYENSPPDMRMLTANLIENINIILSEYVSEQPLDQKRIHAEIVRAVTIERKIEEQVDKTKLPYSHRDLRPDLYRDGAKMRTTCTWIMPTRSPVTSKRPGYF